MKTTLHVTDLDAYLWYQRIESMTADELRGRLLRTEPPNAAMLAGTAWHSILENPPDEISTIERNGFTFRVECDAEIALPQVREIRASKSYLVDGVKVTLTGGCDGISGNVVKDHKLTFRPNPETYAESYQWRAYLDIYNANIFQYLLYHAIEKPDAIVIRDVSTMHFYWYPGIRADLEIGIRDLLGFVRERVPEMIKE